MKSLRGGEQSLLAYSSWSSAERGGAHLSDEQARLFASRVHGRVSAGDGDENSARGRHGCCVVCGVWCEVVGRKRNAKLRKETKRGAQAAGASCSSPMSLAPSSFGFCSVIIISPRQFSNLQRLSAARTCRIGLGPRALRSFHRRTWWRLVEAFLSHSSVYTSTHVQLRPSCKFPAL